MTPMMKQKNIANILNRYPSEVSRLLSGERKVSWPMAKQLSELLPAKTIEQWKESTPDELKMAFKHIVNINTINQQEHHVCTMEVK